jgi:hypothetical protein
MADETQDTNEIVIGDLTFEPVPEGETSLKQTMYTMGEVARSGLRPIAEYQKIEDPSARNFAVAVDLNDSGHCFTLLAGIYRRKGEKWRHDQVAENAAVFENATGEASGKLIATLSAVLLMVFAIGSGSSTTSPTSSPGQKRAAPSSDSSAPAPSTMASGTASSAGSPATTRTSTSGSPTGRVGKRSSPTTISSARARAKSINSP